MANDDDGLTFPPHRKFTPPADGGGSSLSSSAIAGIVIGVLALLIIIAIICYVLFCRRERPRREKASHPKSETESKKSQALPAPPPPPPGPPPSTPAPQPQPVMTYATVYYADIFQPAPQYYLMVATTPGQPYLESPAPHGGGAMPESGQPSAATTTSDSELAQQQALSAKKPTDPSAGRESQKTVPFDEEIGKKMLDVIQQSQSGKGSKAPTKSLDAGPSSTKALPARKMMDPSTGRGSQETVPFDEVIGKKMLEVIQQGQSAKGSKAPTKSLDAGPTSSINAAVPPPVQPMQSPAPIQPKESSKPQKPAAPDDNVAKFIISKQI